MASKITFTKADIVSFTRTREGGTVKFSAGFTSAVCKTMAWTDMPDCQKSGKLDGELNATTVQLTPKNSEAAKHAVQLDGASQFGAFEVTRLELDGQRGKGHRWELRFSVKFSDPNGARKLEQYITSAGEGSLVVSYEKAAVQEELPIATDEQRQAAMDMEVQ